MIEIRLLDRNDADVETVGRIYESSFPKKHFPSMQKLLIALDFEGMDLLGIYCDGEPIGMMLMLRRGRCVYLMYFAVSAEKRGLGIGAEALIVCMKRYPGCFFVGDISCDKADTYKDRRRNMYLKNGCRDTGYYLTYGEEKWDLLTRGGKFDIKELEAAVEYLDEVSMAIGDCPPKLHKKENGDGRLV